jgi:hypothetical protein
MQKLIKKQKIMAIDKAKVLAALQLKFKGKSLSKTFLDKTATRYAAKIETDADMDDFINEREDDILAAGEEADRRVTAATKKPKEDDGKGGKTDAKDEPVLDDDELAKLTPFEKMMMKKLEGMTATISGLQAEKTADTIATRFANDPRLKGIDPKLYKGRIPKTEAEFEATVEEVAEDLKDFVKAEGNEAGGEGGGKPNPIATRLGGKGFGDKPVHSTTQVKTAADKNKEVPAEIQAFTDNLNKSNGVKTNT